jgi:2-(1,2-epoxy-1,2-dihydrophenyl)acetyl-CoA isomerase
MGLVPELASSSFVPQRVGFGAASDLMLSGGWSQRRRPSRSASPTSSWRTTRCSTPPSARARTYGENPARQLRWIKELLTQNAAEADPLVAQRRELERLQECYVSPEHEEAVAAFMEKRPADFRAVAG